MHANCVTIQLSTIKEMFMFSENQKIKSQHPYSLIYEFFHPRSVMTRRSLLGPWFSVCVCDVVFVLLFILVCMVGFCFCAFFLCSALLSSLFSGSH